MPKKEEPTEVHYELCTLQRFVRVIKIPKKENEHFDGYQPEIVWVSNDKVVKRLLIDKPNTFELTFARASDLIDPREDEMHLAEGSKE